MDNLATALKAAAGNSSTAAGATNPNAWDISYGEIDDSNTSGYFDIDQMVISDSTSVNAQEAAPRGMFFKPDGTKMYITGSNGDEVNEFDLSTAWDTTTISYLQNFSVASQETLPTGVHFKPDGTKMYVVGSTSDNVNEYDLSTAWDVSTASYNQNFSVNSQEGVPTDMWFKPDGTKMYIVGNSGDDVNEYNLSTAWDVSTASYNQNFSVAGQETSPRGLWFNSSGTLMLVSGASGDGVDSYSLSTAWDVSTASHVKYINLSGGYSSVGRTGTALPSGNNEYNSFAIFFSADGDRFYMTGSATDKIHQYKVGVKAFYVRTQETIPTSLFFKGNGTKMYVIGQSGDDVNEYNLSTAWDVSTATFSQSKSVKADNSAFISPQGLFFKPDGTKYYVVCKSADAVGEYDLSTAWDVSTATHNQNFSVSGQEATPNAVCFGDDGTKMYVMGHTGDDVNEYDLSTAWDISTASYSQAFSISGQETAPRGLHFKPDGTKMYVTGDTGDDINEYNLSTAWDVSTATYNQNFSIQRYILTAEAIFFKPDGTMFYVMGQSSDFIQQYIIRSS